MRNTEVPALPVHPGYGCAQVESRQRTQRNSTVLVIDVVQRFSRSDSRLGLDLAHWRDSPDQTGYGIAVVSALNIDDQ